MIFPLSSIRFTTIFSITSKRWKILKKKCINPCNKKFNQNNISTHRYLLQKHPTHRYHFNYRVYNYTRIICHEDYDSNPQHLWLSEQLNTMPKYTSTNNIFQPKKKFEPSPIRILEHKLIDKQTDSRTIIRRIVSSIYKIQRKWRETWTEKFNRELQTRARWRKTRWPSPLSRLDKKLSGFYRGGGGGDNVQAAYNKTGRLSWERLSPPGRFSFISDVITRRGGRKKRKGREERGEGYIATYYLRFLDKSFHFEETSNDSLPQDSLGEPRLRMIP